MRWKTRLAVYFRWLRDENWYDEVRKENAATIPEYKARFGATRKTVIETRILKEPFSAEIDRATFIDGTSGYLVIILDSTPRKYGDGEFTVIPEARGWQSDSMYQTLQ